MTPNEKHALVDAASAFEEHGIEILMPWEHDLDLAEGALYEGLLAACRAYHDRMKHAAD
jgi:hypothetical protein